MYVCMYGIYLHIQQRYSPRDAKRVQVKCKNKYLETIDVLTQYVRKKKTKIVLQIYDGNVFNKFPLVPFMRCTLKCWWLTNIENQSLSMCPEGR